MNDHVREGDMIHLLNLDADGHYLAATPLTFDRAHTFGTDGEHEHVRQLRPFLPFSQIWPPCTRQASATHPHRTAHARYSTTYMYAS